MSKEYKVVVSGPGWSEDLLRGPLMGCIGAVVMALRLRMRSIHAPDPGSLKCEFVEGGLCFSMIWGGQVYTYEVLEGN